MNRTADRSDPPLPEPALPPPVALTIAGSDPSGGAGIIADLKTFAAFGVYGTAAITAVTVQNTLGVSAVHPVPPDIVAGQIGAVASDLSVRAAKIGMLAEAAIIEAVAAALDAHTGFPVVLDPVMIATSGDPLIAPSAVDALKRRLLPRCGLVTPNLAEAAALTGSPQAATEADLAGQAAAILALGAPAVLIKGGHGTGDVAIDLLATPAGTRNFARPRIATGNTHGTGCTLSAAIAAGLALGRPLEEAVADAGDYVWRAIAAAREWRLGGGSGPLDHRVASPRRGA